MFYPESVNNIIAIDWCTNILDIAMIKKSSANVKFVEMDSTNLLYNDESFDTIVDTFGLQSSYDYLQQYQEMKRVCKKGGKILLLEIGKSYWRYVNYRTLKRANKELNENGQVLFINYDELVLNDPEIKVIQKKRKLNGSLYYYVLEKI
jgi:ubiquinone/menaquinone biosynthesis C-methylase UbiE